MTKLKWAEELRKIARLYGVRVRFYKGGDGSGTAHLAKRYVTVSMNDVTMEYIAGVVFHEIAHLVNKDTCKFPIYHSPREWNKRKPTAAFLRTAFRAEMYTEKIGKRLMKIHMPWLKFKYAYGDKESKQWLKNYIIESFKKRGNHD